MAQNKSSNALHTLLIPTAGISLLTPSAIIAEVVNVMPFGPLPFSPNWVLGVIPWRQHAVPVVSFEALSGGAPQVPTPRSKIMVFFPFPGRREWEFFGLLTSAEPQPHTIGNTEGMATAMPNSPFIAAGLRVGGIEVGIPDMEALRQTLFP